MATTNSIEWKRWKICIEGKREREREKEREANNVSSSPTISKNKESRQEEGDRSLNIGIKFLQIWEAP